MLRTVICGETAFFLQS